LVSLGPVADLTPLMRIRCDAIAVPALVSFTRIKSFSSRIGPECLAAAADDDPDLPCAAARPAPSSLPD
jgi:hypothetical protein